MNIHELLLRSGWAGEVDGEIVDRRIYEEARPVFPAGKEWIPMPIDVSDLDFDKLSALKHELLVLRSGYAGYLADGSIKDRRYYTCEIPVPGAVDQGVPYPKIINQEITMDKDLTTKVTNAILQSGYAGILTETGMIVDRRIYGGIPIPANESMGIPEAKFIDNPPALGSSLDRDLKLLLTGYAGYTKNGYIVDRRISISALPVPAAPEYGVPEPKPIGASMRKNCEFVFGTGRRPVVSEGFMKGDEQHQGYAEKIEQVYGLPSGSVSNYGKGEAFRKISGPIREVLNDIFTERFRQFDRWGIQSHDYPTWIAILTEEVGEASKEAVDYGCENPPKGGVLSDEIQVDRLRKLRKELIQVAAVAVQIIEALDLDLELED